MEESESFGFLTDRELKHVRFARLYARDYAHGSPGHLDMTIIAQMATEIERLRAELNDTRSRQASALAGEG